MAHVDDLETRRANMGFIRNSMSAPLLSRDGEFALTTAWHDRRDIAALHELVIAYTRLVVATASRMRSYGLPIGDLVQEGTIGLMQATQRFDPDRDVRFSTYAAWWIRAAIQDYVLRNWSIVRTGTTAAQKSLFFNLRRLRGRIEDTSGEAFGDSGRRQIATTLRVDLVEVERMEQRLAANDQSLDAPFSGNGDGAWQDFLADSRPTPEAAVISLRDNRRRSEWLAQALGELSPRERRIINERRLREEGSTLEELGRELGVSKERVRQLESRALSKLRVSISQRVSTPLDLFASY
jgi:RNA polymerase sigma-32 factor